VAQWRAVVGTPASGNKPLGAVQALANVTNSSTLGAAHGLLGPPVPRRARAARVRQAGVARARRCLGARSGVAGWKQFAEALFKIVFLWISKL
jgi:hypothetical protein